MERNWRIKGLTVRNTVIVQVGGREPHDSCESPSSFGSFGLSRVERGILGRGLTSAGNDRSRPKGETIEVPSGDE